MGLVGEPHRQEADLEHRVDGGPGGPGDQPNGVEQNEWYPQWAETITSVELPLLTEEGNGPVVVGDWIVQVTPHMEEDMSSQSAAWWREALLRATQAYDRWLMATPMERLTVVPEVPQAFENGPWAQVGQVQSYLWHPWIGLRWCWQRGRRRWLSNYKWQELHCKWT